MLSTRGGARRSSTPSSAPPSSTATGRCSCSPVRAPARRACSCSGSRTSSRPARDPRGDPGGHVHEQGGGRDAQRGCERCSAARRRDVDRHVPRDLRAAVAQAWRGRRPDPQLHDLRRRRSDEAGREAAQGDRARRSGVGADHPVAVRSREEPRASIRSPRRPARSTTSSSAIYPLYQQQLAKENAVDFNDLLLKTLELWKHEETRRVLEVRFRHVLVDEFQDTNRVQYELVRRLAEATRNLRVVGDDDQSIYAWRGAEPRNLLDFDRDFPDATVVKLEQNYRSTQMILDAANAIIEHNRDRHAEGAVDRRCRRRSDRGLSGRRRARRGVLRRAIDPADARRGPRSRRARSRSSIARTRSRACSRSTCARRACRRRSSARCRSSSAKRSRMSSRICGCSAIRRRTRRSSAIVNVPARGIGETTVDRLRAAARAGAGGTVRGGAARGARRRRGHRRGPAQEAAGRSSS